MRCTRRASYIDKLLRFLLLCPPRLVLEDHVIVPTALDGKVLRIEQRVAPCNLVLALFLFFGCPFSFLFLLALLPFSGEGVLSYLSLLLLLPFSFDLFELSHELGLFVLVITITVRPAHRIANRTTYLSSSLLSSSEPTESASMSRVSSNIRLRFASMSSSSSSKPSSSCRFGG